MRLFNTQGL